MPCPAPELQGSICMAGGHAKVLVGSDSMPAQRLGRPLRRALVHFSPGPIRESPQKKMWYADSLRPCFMPAWTTVVQGSEA